MPLRSDVHVLLVLLACRSALGDAGLHLVIKAAIREKVCLLERDIARLRQFARADSVTTSDGVTHFSRSGLLLLSIYPRMHASPAAVILIPAHACIPSRPEGRGSLNNPFT